MAGALMAHPVNILVVDDLTSQRLTVEVALAELGENIVPVRSGRDALKFLMQNDAAVVLLDVNMPEMDGFETAGLIRQRPRNANTPIIFLTADHDEMQSARGYALGAVDYLTCPFLPDVLRTKVKVFVQLSRAQERIRQEAEQRLAFLREQAARAAAEQQSRRLRLLSEAGGVLMRSLDGTPFEDELLRIMVPALADEAGLQFTDGWERPRAIVWRRIAEGGGVDEVAMPTGTLAAAAAKCIQNSSIMALDRDAQGRPRALVLPIVVPGRTYAVLGVARHGESPGYSTEERDLMTLIAGRAAVALDNRRLFREVQERDRRKDEFLAMLSHELRNPLGAITSASRLLELIGAVDERAIRATQVVSRQSAHLAKIVDDLLDVSRVTVGHITLNRVPVDLRELADHTVDSLRASGQLDNHKVTVSGESTMVHADAGRMQQVITNLIVNSVKYTDHGGKIAIEIDRDETLARIKVQDDGIGITPDLLKNVFEVFVQGEQSLDRAKGGLGIGLTLVKRLIELQDGTVRAFSDGAGKGSTFLIELPRLTGSVRSRRGDRGSARKAGPLNVLVIDDNEDAREMLRTLLQLSGHRVVEAGSGPEAVDVALRTQPDVALVDLGLPGFDGYELSRRLRQDVRTRPIVLIALTGYGQPEDREKTAAYGFLTHLVKPVSPERLDEVFALAAQERGGRVTAG
jgi:CheY-like chemotaxis protein